MSKLGSALHGIALWLAVAAALLVGAGAAALEVDVVAVSPGFSADVSISGGSPITIEIGQTIEGVTVLSADRRGATLRMGGVTTTLPIVSSRGSIGASSSESVTLRADPASGHFVANGSVNGSAVRFIVDTGATLTALSRSHAVRIGIDYQRGVPVQSMTPNGVVNGWRVSLDSVSIGGATEREVDAIVVDNDALPFGLLGMSYLNRFDMQRQGATLVLKRRR
jgi:aspartyl protease family protein